MAAFACIIVGKKRPINSGGLFQGKPLMTYHTIETRYKKGDIRANLHEDCGWLIEGHSRGILFAWMSLNQFSEPHVILTPDVGTHDWHSIDFNFKRLTKLFKGANTFIIIPRTLDGKEPNPSFKDFRAYARKLVQKHANQA